MCGRLAGATAARKQNFTGELLKSKQSQFHWPFADWPFADWLARVSKLRSLKPTRIGALNSVQKHVAFTRPCSTSDNDQTRHQIEISKTKLRVLHLMPLRVKCAKGANSYSTKWVQQSESHDAPSSGRVSQMFNSGCLSEKLC